MNDKLRYQVLRRDSYICQQDYETKTDLDVHHIIPKRQGGLDTLNNLITVCRKCHEWVEPWFRKPLEGKKGVYRLNAMKIRDIKIIAAKKDTTLNNLFVEGIECVLDKYKDLLR